MIETVSIMPDGSRIPGWHHDFQVGETWEVHPVLDWKDFIITLTDPKTDQDIRIDVVPLASALELYRKLKAALREMKGS